MNKKVKQSFLILLTLAILLNINWLKSPELGFIFGFIYLIIFSCCLGAFLFNNAPKYWQVFAGLLSLISAYSLFGAIVYYFSRLDQLTISLLFILISGIIIFFTSKFQVLSGLQSTKEKYPSRNIMDSSRILRMTTVLQDIKFPKLTSANLILLITYLILFLISIFVLFKSQTSEAINSPWQIIPSYFFIIYFIATMNLIILCLKNNNFLTNIAISFHFFLTTAIALIIYKFGYGFDPHIHQATEQAIFNQGLILPKPFYYLGQYSIIVFLAHLFQVSIELIDRLFLPIFLSIFTPVIIYYSLLKSFNWSKNIIRLLSLSFLFLPFGLFLATTPQAIANIYVIIIIFLSFLYLQKKQINFKYLVFLSLTAILIHPLAGIPSLIYLIIVWGINNKFKFQKPILIIFSLLSALALPLALILNSFISIYKINFNFDNFKLIELPNIFAKQFNLFIDIAYIYSNSIYWLIFITALISFIYLLKIKQSKIFLASAICFVILIINSVLLNLINISFIISNEQDFFADRVRQLAFYFLLPLTIYGLYLFIKKSNKQGLVSQLFLIILLTTILVSSLYISYPRFDDYENSKFVNISQADYDAVELIEKDSQNTPYIVLANQMTSVAAVKTFGFSKYYNDYYFYPIPTGGKLYESFIKMLHEDTAKKTMIEAMELTETETAYFVIPTYWSRFVVISQNAATEADQIIKIDDKLNIYKYTK